MAAAAHFATSVQSLVKEYSEKGRISDGNIAAYSALVNGKVEIHLQKIKPYKCLAIATFKF